MFDSVKSLIFNFSIGEPEKREKTAKELFLEVPKLPKKSRLNEGWVEKYLIPPEKTGKPSKNRADLAGQQIGEITVVSLAGIDKRNNSAIWDCFCSCGQYFLASTFELRRKNPRKVCGRCPSNVYSCGEYAEIEVFRRGERFFTKIDLEDIDLVGNERWFVNEDGYVFSPRTNTRLARLVKDAPQDKQVDHINQDKLDNRRSNLRLCDCAENKNNQKSRKDSKSGYKGVVKVGKKYNVYVGRSGENRYRGRYKTLREAVLVANWWRLELFGEFAYTDPVPEG